MTACSLLPPAAGGRLCSRWPGRDHLSGRVTLWPRRGALAPAPPPKLRQAKARRSSSVTLAASRGGGGRGRARALSGGAGARGRGGFPAARGESARAAKRALCLKARLPP